MRTKIEIKEHLKLVAGYLCLSKVCFSSAFNLLFDIMVVSEARGVLWVKSKMAAALLNFIPRGGLALLDSGGG